MLSFSLLSTIFHHFIICPVLPFYCILYFTFFRDFSLHFFFLVYIYFITIIIYHVIMFDIYVLLCTHLLMCIWQILYIKYLSRILKYFSTWSYICVYIYIYMCVCMHCFDTSLLKHGVTQCFTYVTEMMTFRNA